MWYFQLKIINQCIGLYIYIYWSTYMYVYIHTEHPSYLIIHSRCHSDHILKFFSDIMETRKIFFFCLTHFWHFMAQITKTTLHKCCHKFLSISFVVDLFQPGLCPLYFFKKTKSETASCSQDLYWLQLLFHPNLSSEILSTLVRWLSSPFFPPTFLTHLLAHFWGAFSYMPSSFQ